MACRGWQHDRNTKLWTEERVDRLAHLRCVEGLDFSEIGKILGATPAAVENQIEIHGLCLTPQAKAAIRRRKCL